MLKLDPLASPIRLRQPEARIPNLIATLYERSRMVACGRERSTHAFGEKRSPAGLSRVWPGQKVAPSAGFEPAHTAPEADALSPELRGRGWGILGRKPAPVRAGQVERRPGARPRRAARSGCGTVSEPIRARRIGGRVCGVCSSGLRGELGAASLVAMEREAVDHECVAEEVEVLAGVADAVGASEPEGVFEVAVDRLGVVAAGIQPGEVGVGRVGWVGRFRSG